MKILLNGAAGFIGSTTTHQPAGAPFKHAS